VLGGQQVEEDEEEEPVRVWMDYIEYIHNSSIGIYVTDTYAIRIRRRLSCHVLYVRAVYSLV
jgi:hypothetical protein